MTDDPHDEFLEEAFHGLRDEVTTHAPSFADVLHKPRAEVLRTRLPAWLPVAAALALMVGGSTWFITRDSYPRLPDAYNVASWEAPTDFLLQSRLRDFMRSVPKIGYLELPDYNALYDTTPTTTDTSTEGRIQL